MPASMPACSTFRICSCSKLSGPGAADLIARACPLDAAGLAMSQSKYTFFLNERAGIIDDLIVTRLGDDRFMIVANAGNAAEDEAHLRALAAGFDCKVEALDRVFLAIQGPEAWAALARAGVETGVAALHDTASSRGRAGS